MCVCVFFGCMCAIVPVRECVFGCVRGRVCMCVFMDKGWVCLFGCVCVSALNCFIARALFFADAPLWVVSRRALTWGQGFVLTAHSGTITTSNIDKNSNFVKNKEKVCFVTFRYLTRWISGNYIFLFEILMGYSTRYYLKNKPHPKFVKQFLAE